MIAAFLRHAELPVVKLHLLDRGRRATGTDAQLDPARAWCRSSSRTGCRRSRRGPTNVLLPFRRTRTLPLTGRTTTRLVELAAPGPASATGSGRRGRQEAGAADAGARPGPSRRRGSRGTGRAAAAPGGRPPRGPAPAATASSPARRRSGPRRVPDGQLTPSSEHACTTWKPSAWLLDHTACSRPAGSCDRYISLASPLAVNRHPRPEARPVEPAHEQPAGLVAGDQEQPARTARQPRVGDVADVGRRRPARRVVDVARCRCSAGTRLGESQARRTARAGSPRRPCRPSRCTGWSRRRASRSASPRRAAVERDVLQQRAARRRRWRPRSTCRPGRPPTRRSPRSPPDHGAAWEA